MDERKNPRTTETDDDERETTWQPDGQTQRPRADEDDTATGTKVRPDMPQQKPDHKPDHKPQPKPQQTHDKKK